MANSTTNASVDPTTNVDLESPRKVWNARDPPFEGYVEPQKDGFEKSARLLSSGEPAAIVIDNGSSTVRAGWSFEKDPRVSLPPIMSRYRDRKLGKTYTFVGSNAYVDATTRGNIRTACEAGSGIVGNWDVMEGVLDYIFLKMGVDGAEGGVGRPIVMTEPVANLGYSRKTMSEIVFECYSAPSLAYGIDSLFSYQYNGGNTGLVVSSSHSSTQLIPVVNQKAMLSQATRLNWGGSQGAEYLLKLLQLKYPYFPGKITSAQAEELVREHCYVSQDYEEELSRMLDWTGLEDRDHTIQWPFTEQVVTAKTEEELARAAEKRKESGRRLQAQAAKMRLERLVKKEQELEYYKELQAKASTESKKEFRRLLESNDFETEAQLEKAIRELDKNIRKARTKDVGGPEVEEEEEEQTFPLLEVPDAELDEAGVRQKRHQRLMKSNNEARARAKAEKEKEKARMEEEQRADEDRRVHDLDGWVAARRAAREALLQKLKLRQRLRADLTNRKSLASQLRMKSIAALASDNPSKKRRRGPDASTTRDNPDRDDNDTFGADDDDWGVYRTLGTHAEGSDDEDGGGGDDDLHAQLLALEADLLSHDAHFTPDDTHAAQTGWHKSLLHAFTRGARPFDDDSARETHQMHLNVERIRVPEVVFQPSIAGLDQAGLVEIASDILTQRLAGAGLRERAMRDVFLTGGNTLFEGFEARLRRELVAVLPAGGELAVRRARDARLDAWRGAARWVGQKGWSEASVSRAEWEECGGGGYLKEHGAGNGWGGSAF